MLKKFAASEKLRFLAIGGLNTVVGYLFFVIAYRILGDALYIQAYVLSYIVALLSGFTLQRLLVFKVKGRLLLDFSRYTLVQLGAFAVNLILLPTFVEVLGLQPLLAQAIILIITVVGSYFAHRYFSFRRRDHLTEASSLEKENGGLQ